jgi:hypothetical protein
LHPSSDRSSKTNTFFKRLIMDPTGNKNVSPTKADEEVTVKGDVEGLDADPEMVHALQNYAPGTPEEKRLVRKIDFVLLPCLWWMYVLAYLDRGNVVSNIGYFHSTSS